MFMHTCDAISGLAWSSRIATCSLHPASSAALDFPLMPPMGIEVTWDAHGRAAYGCS